MLKVLIVDDEYLQRELLKASVDWDKLDMEITGEAEDGKQALLLFEECKPEIVIMDINIPFINGIEVSKRIKKKAPDTQILILTAYGEFDYAKDALNLGASAFVLKPLDSEELFQKLSQTRNHIKSAIFQKESFLELQRENLQMEKEQFLLECLAGLTDENDIKQKCKKFQIPSNQKICVLDIRFSDSIVKSKFQEEIQEFIEEQFKACECIHMEKDILILLFNEQTEEEFRVKIYWLHKTLNEEMEDKENIMGSISDIHSSIIKLPAAYREAYSIINRTGAARENSPIRFRKYETPTLHSFIKTMPYKPDALLRSLRAKEYEHIYGQIEDIYKKLDKENYVREAAVYIAMDILLNVTSYLMEFGIDITKELEQEHEIIAGLSGSGRNKDIKELLFIFLKKGIELIETHTPSSGKRKAYDAKSYIEQNYYLSDLSLNTVSEEIGVNSSYLSNIFKKEFQYSLSRYIIKVRLEHAIRYMKENRDATLSEIAEEVGYTDVYYFSKSFKSYFGITPSKYMEERT